MIKFISLTDENENTIIINIDCILTIYYCKNKDTASMSYQTDAIHCSKIPLNKEDYNRFAKCLLGL